LPAQSFVPFTVPTSLHPIGAFGFTCTSGLFPTLGALGLGVCANAVAEKIIAARISKTLIIISSPSGRALQLSTQSNAASLRLAVAGIFDLVCKPNALSDFVDVDASVLQGSDVKKNVWSARIILDEAESAVCVPHFQCTGGHLLSLLQPELDQAADGFLD
jgi:hypothetical protein